MNKNHVEIIIISATLLILLWDLWLYRDQYPGNTISEIVIRRTKEQPVIPLLCGLLMGHWFW
jgi:uncharacterized membrane protein